MIKEENIMEYKLCQTDDLDPIFSLRKEIFVKEQGFPENEEIDYVDKFAVHIACYNSDEVIACGRIYIKEKIAHFCRICVKKSYRNIGIGTLLCRFMIEYAKQNKCEKIVLNSQLHAISFYEKLGFIGESEIMDAGVIHIKMKLELSNH